MPIQHGKLFYFALILLIGATLILFGCSSIGDQAQEDIIEAEAQAVSTATPTPMPTATPQTADESLQTEIVLEPISPVSPVSPIVTAVVAGSPVDPIPGSEEALAAAVEDLTQKTTGIATDQIKLIAMEAVEWDDGSLGCPQEGEMSIQVVTPGYRIVLETQGVQFVYHTDQTSNVILCSTTPVDSPATPPPAGDEPMSDEQMSIDAAIQDLAGQLGIAADQINVVSVESVEWSDASLGCPQEGFMYAQVITPGYKIILEAQGQQYEYHTDLGSNVVLCQQ